MYIIKGKVVHGEKIGRKIGFPTANIETENECDIANGVYSAYIIYKGIKYKAMDLP